ncbi:unnamed protein product [Macrosiphum euphorbiae]|uniref:Uncharacterized protein n=1 Tax=Macrosiphum euphorbiae TaxID=13131 RepID=A0AAV0X7M6_9HEMI|nr:unnamed protein product [Macrosiphum euphorbiae]
MSSDDDNVQGGQASQEPKGPTYNELIALIDKLQARLLSNKSDDGDANNHEQNRSVSKLSTRQPALDFRVLPDLDKTVGVFNGRESTHAAYISRRCG